MARFAGGCSTLGIRLLGGLENPFNFVVSSSSRLMPGCRKTLESVNSGVRIDGFRDGVIPFKNSNFLVAVTSPFADIDDVTDGNADETSSKFKARTFFRMIGRPKMRLDDAGESKT